MSTRHRYFPYVDVPDRWSDIVFDIRKRPGEMAPGLDHIDIGGVLWTFDHAVIDPSDKYERIVTYSGDDGCIEHHHRHDDLIVVHPRWIDGTTSEERLAWSECHWHCDDDCATKHRSADVMCKPRFEPWRNGYRCGGDLLCCPSLAQ